ncbi:hypothetical protein HK101_010957 [Irineochytrium annulatum]|nr:hypothetical protein HK101_010957 [Irineochytrium annulatum]
MPLIVELEEGEELPGVAMHSPAPPRRPSYDDLEEKEGEDGEGGLYQPPSEGDSEGEYEDDSFEDDGDEKGDEEAWTAQAAAQLGTTVPVQFLFRGSGIGGDGTDSDDETDEEDADDGNNDRESDGPPVRLSPGRPVARDAKQREVGGSSDESEPSEAAVGEVAAAAAPADESDPYSDSDMDEDEDDDEDDEEDFAVQAESVLEGTPDIVMPPAGESDEAEDRVNSPLVETAEELLPPVDEAGEPETLDDPRLPSDEAEGLPKLSGFDTLTEFLSKLRETMPGAFADITEDIDRRQPFSSWSAALNSAGRMARSNGCCRTPYLHDLNLCSSLDVSNLRNLLCQRKSQTADHVAAVQAVTQAQIKLDGVHGDQTEDIEKLRILQENVKTLGVALTKTHNQIKAVDHTISARIRSNHEAACLALGRRANGEYFDHKQDGRGTLRGSRRYQAKDSRRWRGIESSSEANRKRLSELDQAKRVLASHKQRHQYIVMNDHVKFTENRKVPVYASLDGDDDSAHRAKIPGYELLKRERMNELGARGVEMKKKNRFVVLEFPSQPTSPVVSFKTTALTRIYSVEWMCGGAKERRVTEYEVWTRLNGLDWKREWAGTETSCELELADDGVIQFRVRAKNELGWSVPSYPRDITVGPVEKSSKRKAGTEAAPAGEAEATRVVVEADASESVDFRSKLNEIKTTYGVQDRLSHLQELLLFAEGHTPPIPEVLKEIRAAITFVTDHSKKEARALSSQWRTKLSGMTTDVLRTPDHTQLASTSSDLADMLESLSRDVEIDPVTPAVRNQIAQAITGLIIKRPKKLTPVVSKSGTVVTPGLQALRRIAHVADTFLAAIRAKVVGGPTSEEEAEEWVSLITNEIDRAYGREEEKVEIMKREEAERLERVEKARVAREKKEKEKEEEQKRRKEEFERKEAEAIAKRLAEEEMLAREAEVRMRAAKIERDRIADAERKRKEEARVVAAAKAKERIEAQRAKTASELPKVVDPVASHANADRRVRPDAGQREANTRPFHNQGVPNAPLTIICRYFNTRSGCANGNSCKFKHVRGQLCDPQVVENSARGPTHDGPGQATARRPSAERGHAGPSQPTPRRPSAELAPATAAAAPKVPATAAPGPKVPTTTAPIPKVPTMSAPAAKVPTPVALVPTTPTPTIAAVPSAALPLATALPVASPKTSAPAPQKSRSMRTLQFGDLPPANHSPRLTTRSEENLRKPSLPVATKAGNVSMRPVAGPTLTSAGPRTHIQGQVATTAPSSTATVLVRPAFAPQPGRAPAPSIETAATHLRPQAHVPSTAPPHLRPQTHGPMAALGPAPAPVRARSLSHGTPSQVQVLTRPTPNSSAPAQAPAHARIEPLRPTAQICAEPVRPAHLSQATAQGKAPLERPRHMKENIEPVPYVAPQQLVPSQVISINPISFETRKAAAEALVPMVAAAAEEAGIGSDNQRRPPKVCKFFQSARGCDRGTSCQFAHVPTPQVVVPEQKTTAAPSVARRSLEDGSSSRRVESKQEGFGESKVVTNRTGSPIVVTIQKNETGDLKSVEKGAVGTASEQSGPLVPTKPPAKPSTKPAVQNPSPPPTQVASSVARVPAANKKPKRDAASKTRSRPCHFYGSAAGCLRGDDCSFAHGEAKVNGMDGASPAVSAAVKGPVAKGADAKVPYVSLGRDGEGDNDAGNLSTERIESWADEVMGADPSTLQVPPSYLSTHLTTVQEVSESSEDGRATGLKGLAGGLKETGEIDTIGVLGKMLKLPAVLVQNLRSNDVRDSDLLRLNEGDLENLGFTSAGLRRKFMKAAKSVA